MTASHRLSIYTGSHIITGPLAISVTIHTYFINFITVIVEALTLNPTPLRQY